MLEHMVQRAAGVALETPPAATHPCPGLVYLGLSLGDPRGAKQWGLGVGRAGRVSRASLLPSPVALLETHPSPAPPRTHMQNIKDITSTIHFEAYRVKRLHEGSSAVANGVEEKAPEAQEM